MLPITTRLALRLPSLTNTTRRCLSSSLYAHSAAAATEEAIITSPKISTLVEQIATLSLLETAELVKSLKVKLNIQEVAMPAMTAPSNAPSASSAVAEEAAVAPPAEKTMFKVTLEKFDAASKAKIIKEVKGLLPGANLVEAKKFVESVPKVIREDVSKEEAEKMKKTLEALGATVILD